MKLQQIAARIDEHLKRFESNPRINKRDRKDSLLPYWCTSAVASGSRVLVCYISFQGSSSMKKSEAEEYLKWLDEGNVGTHYEYNRTKKGNSKK